MAQETTNKQQQATIATIVNNITSQNVPEFEKLLLQMRVFKEKRMYSTALQCFKKGIKIIQDELKQTNGDNELKVKLTISKARYNIVESTMDVITFGSIQILQLCGRCVLRNQKIFKSHFIFDTSYKFMQGHIG